MSLESSLARQITRLLYEQRADKHPAAWTALRCDPCGRLRPFQVDAFTHHTRFLWRRSEKFRATVTCSFCGAKHRLPFDQRVPADERWTPERPMAELVAATAPGVSYKPAAESDEVLLKMFDQIQKSGQRWKGNTQLGWKSWLVGITLGLLTAGLIYVTGLDAFWRFEDNSGSVLYFVVPPIVTVLGMIFEAKRGVPASVREKLAERIKTFNLDPSRLRQLALNSGRRNAAIVLALDEMKHQARVS